MAEGSVGLDGPFVAIGKGVQERRFWADLIDVVALPAVLGAGLNAMLDVPVGVFGLGGLLTMPLLVAGEAFRQRTPGKALLDLQVQQVDGDAVGGRSALLRRVWMAVSSPSTTSSSFRAFEQAEQLRCDVTHDGWLYAQRQRTVLLEPGDSFSGRFGPQGTLTMARAGNW